jgi:hypothetical protein
MSRQSNCNLTLLLARDVRGVFVTCDETTSKDSPVCIDPV